MWPVLNFWCQLNYKLYMTYIMSYEVISLLCYQNRNKAYTILFTIGNHANFHTGSSIN